MTFCAGLPCGVALNIHSCYFGLERVFEKIASAVDSSQPQGINWHKELLNQMALEIPNVRPAVISEKSRELLDPYRGFRHVSRNVYTYHIMPEKMKLGLHALHYLLFKAVR